MSCPEDSVGSAGLCAPPSNEPPLFDFQVNGFAGVDFQRPDVSAPALEHAAAALRAHQVGCIFVTFITAPLEQLAQQLRRFELFREASPSLSAMIAGYHLEGPWLSPQPGYCGAHPPAHMHAPSIVEFETLQRAARGRIRLVTLAPEWAGSSEFITHLTARQVAVSLGHTNATERDIDAAIAAGARFCTHLGNAVPLVLPRHDNVVQQLLSRDELIACFIPDGLHLPRRVLQNFVRAKPPGRALFTTDAMAGAGAPAGNYTLGDLTVNVGADGIARNPGGGFAGSTLPPDDGVRRVAEYLALPPHEARRLWSTTAAAAFGVTLSAPSIS
ncbi:amidohydrolase family protein [Opitutus sp. ER46]|uniref:amidohydrolase family protein n=1 Tax=Opitutus sp. ER46 TaxID=2161864 RepID=UPI000D322DF6|nr:amidohydrolase family protein [Opitutus sp. ER46]PTY00380.1 N-acetylglucosamine-6-phosphate deacetylase [Opitutus sp. ER46]